MRVGDYVRSSWGTISKIIEYTPYEDDECFSITLEDGTNTFYKHQWQFENNYKSSTNIIDLIEKYDLVNGHLVIYKMYENEKDIPTIVKCVGDYYFKEKDIKSILTKEMFEKMKYRIGE